MRVMGLTGTRVGPIRDSSPPRRPLRTGLTRLVREHGGAQEDGWRSLRQSLVHPLRDGLLSDSAQLTGLVMRMVSLELAEQQLTSHVALRSCSDVTEGTRRSIFEALCYYSPLASAFILWWTRS